MIRHVTSRSGISSPDELLLCVIIVYCTFYSVCNTDASNVCAIKITYLLTYLPLTSCQRKRPPNA